MEFDVKIEERPCHFWQPFVKSDGYMYPCCKIWGNESLRMCHINDSDFIERIIQYDQTCKCEFYRLRKANTNETQQIDLLNIEFSLACNGQCAMCAVGAPEWTGKYNGYDKLAELIDEFKPKELFVQGGEVLIQKKTLNWLQGVKEKYPNIKIDIVSNGCVGLGRIETFEKLFDFSIFSFVGFQPLTYTRIMGLNLSKTIRFVEELIKRNKVKVETKFLCTPNNIHEVPLFLEWAFGKLPSSILLMEMGEFDCYINRHTRDNYWDKIFKRTGDEIRELLVRSKNLLEEKQLSIKITSFLRNEFSIDDDFVREHGFSILLPY